MHIWDNIARITIAKTIHPINRLALATQCYTITAQQREIVLLQLKPLVDVTNFIRSGAIRSVIQKSEPNPVSLATKAPS